MTFETHGVPIHTRALQVTLEARPGDTVGFDARLLDLRKRGCVPVGGDLQPAGIVHQMGVAGEVDTRTATIRRIDATMPSVAFEPSAITRGESCRDVSGRVAELAGAPLDDGFARHVGGRFGGPLGCSHLLTLVHLLGPTVAWALAEDRRLVGAAAVRRPGERVFRRDVVIDGHAIGDDGLDLVLQTTDLHLRPSPEIATSLDRFAGQAEIRVAVRMAMPALEISRATVADRRRAPGDIAATSWRARPGRADALLGLPLRGGAAARLLRIFDPPGDDRPLRDSLLMLAPAVIQCFASYPDDWRSVARGGGETRGLPDTCHMWRRDGALLRARVTGGN